MITAYTVAEMGLSDSPPQAYALWMESVHFHIETGFFCIYYVEIMSGE